MKTNLKSVAVQLIALIIASSLSLQVVIFVIPQPYAFDDIIWLLLDIVAVVLISCIFLGWLGRTRPALIWLAWPIQIALFYMQGDTISSAWGMGRSGLGGFRFLYVSVVWPALITLGLFTATLCYRRIRKQITHDHTA